MNKITHLIMLGALAALLLLPAKSEARTRIYVRFGPPVAKVTVVKPVKPYRSSVWVSGHWQYRKGRYVWVKGHWLKPRPGYRYISAHWRRTPRGHYYIPGHWIRIR